MSLALQNFTLGDEENNSGKWSGLSLSSFGFSLF